MSEEFIRAKRGLKQRLIEDLGMSYVDDSYSYTCDGVQIAGEALDRDPIKYLSMKLPHRSGDIAEIALKCYKDRPIEMGLGLLEQKLLNEKLTTKK